MLKVGDKAPEFTVVDHEGKVHRLSDYQGKSVVLWFYPKADTPGCTIEGCNFRDASENFSRKNAHILGVSFDTPEENKHFHEKFHFTFPLLCDTDRKIGMAYGAISDPGQEFPNRISYLIGPDGTIQQAYGSVKVKEHANEVLNAL